MSTLRRLYPPMLVVIAVMMILTACAAPAAPAADTAAQAPADEKVTLRMTALGGIVAEAVTALTDNYMEENPNVEIIVDVQGDDMSWQKTAPTTMFAVSDGPDFSWWWCGRFAQFNDMMDAGMLASLDDLYESEGWNEAFPQGTLDYFTHTDGHRYGVNLDAVWTPMVYYNKDIFAEAGVEPPTTWEEFYALGDKIREAGYETLTTPYEMGVRSHLPDGLMLRSWTEQEYQAFLLNWMPDAPEWSLEHKWTDPNGVRIYQYIMDMADSGLLMEGYAGITDYGQSQGAFPLRQGGYVPGRKLVDGRDLSARRDHLRLGLLLLPAPGPGQLRRDGFLRCQLPDRFRGSGQCGGVQGRDRLYPAAGKHGAVG